MYKKNQIQVLTNSYPLGLLRIGQLLNISHKLSLVSELSISDLLKSYVKIHFSLTDLKSADSPSS